MTEEEAHKQLSEMRDSSNEAERYVARTMLPGRDDGAACLHLRAKRGPGSAHNFAVCAGCGKSLGLMVNPDAIMAHIKSQQDSLEEALEWQRNQARGCKIEE